MTTENTMELTDYVIYIDTDSVFLNMGRFIEDQGLIEQWDALEEEDRIQWCIALSQEISDHVNMRVRTQTKEIDYCSPIDDYDIIFKQEVVAASGVWVQKKKYFLNIIDNEGYRPDNPLFVRGLEVVRSDTPVAALPLLKEIMLDILKGITDEDLYNKVSGYKKLMMTAPIEDVAVNKNIKNVWKYVDEETLMPLKGAQMHMKGVGNYIKLLRELGIEDKYPQIEDGEKAKSVYLKTNPWGFDSMTFIRWPKEFSDKMLTVDRERQIKKNLEHKIEMLLEPMGRQGALDSGTALISMFF